MWAVVDARAVGLESWWEWLAAAGDGEEGAGEGDFENT